MNYSKFKLGKSIRFSKKGQEKFLCGIVLKKSLNLLFVKDKHNHFYEVNYEKYDIFTYQEYQRREKRNIIEFHNPDICLIDKNDGEIKTILDFTGEYTRKICENVINDIKKQCEKQEKDLKRTEKMCKTIITKIITKIKKEQYRKHHNLILGYLNNEIKPRDNVYVTYDFILKSLKIYEIDWEFLSKVEKIKQKLENIPSKPGIYILECGKYIYIGETINLQTRLIEHYSGFGSLCTQNNEITKIKQILPLENFPNYDNILKHKDYEGYKALKMTLLYCEKNCISIYSSFYPREMINPR